MKILVFSDSHARAHNMERASVLHPEAQYIFHLGDGTREFELMRSLLPERCLVSSVAGNFEELTLGGGDKQAIVELEGVRFLLCHGHRFGVKGSTDTLESYARERQIDFALFGHTHLPCNRYLPDGERPLTLFNPGSISLPARGAPSYGMIEIRAGSVLAVNAELV